MSAPFDDAGGDTRLHLSAMTRVYWRKKDGVRRLDMGEITRIEIFDGGFKALESYVLDRLAYPRPTADKHETYAWVPTLYEWSMDVRDGKFEEGCWRDGDHEWPRLCLMYSDVDNKIADRPHMSEAGVAAALADLLGGPIRFFTYTSWSSAPAHRKFRVVYDTSRWLTREEMRRVHIALNETVFGLQGDNSIYDRGDMIFGPPHGADVTRHDGRALDVDLLLGLEAALRAERPEEIAARYDPRPRKTHARPAGPLPLGEEARLRKRIVDASVRTGFQGIDDPAIFNPGWRDEFAQTAIQGSHYATMLSLLGRVWRKTGGTLSRGEMLAVFDEIDATDAFYMRSKYGVEKAAEMVDFVMSCPVTGWKPISHDPRRLLAVLRRARARPGG